ncbi:hypothetical protein B0T10DRAFT_416627, partial [Thelonectria olida]
QTLQERDMVRYLPCGHMFHSKCMHHEVFLKQHESCPICKFCYMPGTASPRGSPIVGRRDAFITALLHFHSFHVATDGITTASLRSPSVILRRKVF